ncbi:MAG: hypothetical protein M1821_007477 [Bathelium mastoideum]|nr:MAG: hypothetical protein M1821_007477 [Bathelium mastoideum]
MPSITLPPPLSKDIQVQLEYLADLPLYKTTKPLQYVPGFENDQRSTVCLNSGPPETLHDVRGTALDNFTLDDNGFKYVKAPTDFRDWNSQDAVAEIYISEMEALLRKEVEGVDEIVIFDARIRHGESSGTKAHDGLHYNPFARQVHVDQTESSIITKIRTLTELKANFLLRGRSRIINVWRPIRHPVYDCGLAIADGGMLKDGDVIECDRMRRDDGLFWDTMGVVKYREGYRWHYMSEQAEEDVLIFKNYDSDKRVKARHCLHTAFDVPFPPPHAPPRQSIEIRALIFTHPPPDSTPNPTLSRFPSPSPSPFSSSTPSSASSPATTPSVVRTLADCLRPNYPSPSPPSSVSPTPLTPSPTSSSITSPFPSSHPHAPPGGASDLLPESFAVPACGVTVADVALLATEVARLRALLGASARAGAEARAALECERRRRVAAEKAVARVREVVGWEMVEGEEEGGEDGVVEGGRRT